MMRKLIPVLALMIPLFGACSDIEITVPEDFCFFCVDHGPPPHQFVVSGTVNLAGAPAAVRLELIAAAAGSVTRTRRLFTGLLRKAPTRFGHGAATSSSTAVRPAHWSPPR